MASAGALPGPLAFFLYMGRFQITPEERVLSKLFGAEYSAYKARVLAEYEALPAFSVERGALLRREGLYGSHIAEWRNVARAAAVEHTARHSRPVHKRREQRFGKAVGFNALDASGRVFVFCRNMRSAENNVPHRKKCGERSTAAPL